MAYYIFQLVITSEEFSVWEDESAPLNSKCAGSKM